mgnify:CR=1 FL=1
MTSGLKGGVVEDGDDGEAGWFQQVGDLFRGEDEEGGFGDGLLAIGVGAADAEGDLRVIGGLVLVVALEGDAVFFGGCKFSGIGGQKAGEIDQLQHEGTARVQDLAEALEADCEAGFREMGEGVAHAEDEIGRSGEKKVGFGHGAGDPVHVQAQSGATLSGLLDHICGEIDAGDSDAEIGKGKGIKTCAGGSIDGALDRAGSEVLLQAVYECSGGHQPFVKGNHLIIGCGLGIVEFVWLHGEFTVLLFVVYIAHTRHSFPAAPTGRDYIREVRKFRSRSRNPIPKPDYRAVPGGFSVQGTGTSASAAVPRVQQCRVQQCRVQQCRV